MTIITESAENWCFLHAETVYKNPLTCYFGFLILPN